MAVGGFVKINRAYVCGLVSHGFPSWMHSFLTTSVPGTDSRNLGKIKNAYWILMNEEITGMTDWLNTALADNALKVDSDGKIANVCQCVLVFSRCANHTPTWQTSSPHRRFRTVRGNGFVLLILKHKRALPPRTLRSFYYFHLYMCVLVGNYYGAPSSLLGPERCVCMFLVCTQAESQKHSPLVDTPSPKQNCVFPAPLTHSLARSV